MKYYIIKKPILISICCLTITFNVFSYDRTAAVNYAEDWWDGRNSTNPDLCDPYKDYSCNDCANFASQCLIAGGLDISQSGYHECGCLIRVDDLHTNLVDHQDAEYTQIVDVGLAPDNITEGDVILLGDSNDNWKHSLIVVSGSGDNVLCNCHCYDAHQASWRDWFPSIYPVANFYHIPDETGFEDYLTISESPDYVDQNSSCHVEGYGIDEPPNGGFCCDLKLYAMSTDGDVLLGTAESCDFYLNWSFDLDVPSLSSFNKTWLIQNSCISGYFEMTWQDLTVGAGVLIYPPYENGELRQDEEWSGNINIYGNLNVPSDVTLTIQSGTDIFFKDNTQLTVNGTLDAQGTSSEPIVFTSANPNPSPSDWDEIIINSGGSFIFDHVEMYASRYGIKPRYTSGTIKNSKFDNNYVAAYLYHVDNITISNCDFIDNTYGTYAYHSNDIELKNNHYNTNKNYSI